MHSGRGQRRRDHVCPGLTGGASVVGIDAGGGGLTSIVCTSTDSCTAVDDNDRQLTFDPKAPGSPTPHTLSGSGAGLSGVACPTSTLCTAVDLIGEAITFDPASGNIQHSHTVSTGFGGVSALACPPASECVIGDSTGNVGTFDPNAPAPDTTEIDGSTPFGAIACSGPDACVAADLTGHVFQLDPASPNGASAVPITPNGIDAIACPSAYECVAADRGGGVVVGAAAPVNTSAPQISGSAVEGQTLTASTGGWDGGPTSYSYQWEECGATGTGCTAVSGAVDASYTLTSADVGHTIVAQVTAANLGVSGSPATSSATAVVQSPAVAPRASASPQISGVPQVGRMLTATSGIWQGTAPVTLIYGWQRCTSAAASSCTTIAGATSAAYHPLGRTLRVRVLLHLTRRELRRRRWATTLRLVLAPAQGRATTRSRNVTLVR